MAGMGEFFLQQVLAHTGHRTVWMPAAAVAEFLPAASSALCKAYALTIPLQLGY